MSAFSPADKRLAETAVKRGFCTPEQIEEGRRVQSRLAEKKEQEGLLAVLERAWALRAYLDEHILPYMVDMGFSANMFDNPILDKVSGLTLTIAVIAAIVGLILGFIIKKVIGKPAPPKSDANESE